MSDGPSYIRLSAPEGTLEVALSADLLDRIAVRAAELVEQRAPAGGGGASPYLTVAEAAAYLRAKPQRVYDLLSARRLTRHKDGSRTLVSRAELDAHLAREPARPVAPALPPTRRSRLPKGIAE